LIFHIIKRRIWPTRENPKTKLIIHSHFTVKKGYHFFCRHFPSFSRSTVCMIPENSK